MKRYWLSLAVLVVLAAPELRAQMTQVSALVMDTNGERYVNCQWSVVFQNQNTVPGAPPSQPAALLVGQQGNCDSSGNLRVSLADNVTTITPTPSQWRFSICSAPGYVPGGTYCKSNMLVTITGASQDLTSFFQPLMPLLPTGGGGGGGGAGYITDATPLGGLMKTGSTLGLQTTCVAGQYLGWTGSAWACTGAGVGGGTSVSINGTQAVPNSLNFTNTLIPPVGSSVVNFLLNGNTVGAYVTGGGGAALTVNGAAAGNDFNDRLPAFPPNGINISWQTANGHISGAIVGDGIPTHCFLGTGVFAVCPGTGGTAGVSSINGATGAFNFTGSVSCSGTTCNFTGGGAGGFPPTPQYDLFASTGAGAAQASGVAATSGFLRAQVLESTGDSSASVPSGFTPPNASVEYFPTGATVGGIAVGGANGLAIHFSHSNVSGQAGNGGIALAGGNSSGVWTSYQTYLDCEQATGCDFKVPVSHNGTALGGGAAGSGTVNSGTLGHFTWYAAAGTTVSSNANLDDSATTPATITSQETIAAPGINVTGSGGIAMTGAGGALPAPQPSQGGIGIGPGNVPEFYSNGGAWTAIGGGGSGSGTVGTGTAQQLAVYSAPNTVVGSPNISDTGTAIVATVPINTQQVTVGTGILSANGTNTPPATISGVGQIFFNSAGNIQISQSGNSFRSILTPLVNSVAASGNQVTMNFMGTGANPPVCTPAAPTNGRCITFQQSSSAQISGSIVGDGNVSNCLSGIGTYVPCSGGTGGGGTALSIDGNSAGSALNIVSTGTPPANSRIIAWNAPTSGATMAYLTGSGNAGDCLLGNGTFAPCPSGVGGSGTVSPNNTANLTPIAQYTAAGGSTTVSPSSFMTVGPSQDSLGLYNDYITRIAQYAWAFGGNPTAETGMVRSGNSCVPVGPPVSFSTTAGQVCQRTMPVLARQWIMHCVIPWSFVSGTGNANVQFQISPGNANAPTANSIFSTQIWSPTGGVFGTKQIVTTTNGPQVVYTTASLVASDPTLYTAYIDGVFFYPAAAGTMTVTVNIQSGTATGQIDAGAYCRIE